jgi:hypothetical protein
MAASKDQLPLRALITGAGVQFKSGFGAGAAADANIAITGIKVGDVIIGAFEVVPHPAVAGAADVLKTNLLSDIAITSDGNVQCDTLATTGNQVLVFWMARTR